MSYCCYGNFVYTDEPKGRRDVDLPFDDYFMALAVLAKSRSVYPKKQVSVTIQYKPGLSDWEIYFCVAQRVNG